MCHSGDYEDRDSEIRIESEMIYSFSIKSTRDIFNVKTHTNQQRKKIYIRSTYNWNLKQDGKKM